MLLQFNPEIAPISPKLRHLSLGEQLDVRMFYCFQKETLDYLDVTVEKGRLLYQAYFQARIGQVKGGSQASDAAAHDQYRFGHGISSPLYS